MERRTLIYLLRSRSGAFGLAVVIALAAIAILAPLIATYSPNAIDAAHRLQPPSGAHFLGTDHLGRDLFSRLVFGTRVALSVAAVVMAISLSLGVAIGIIAASAGRLVDQSILTIFDIISSFPSIILALSLVAVLGPGLGNVILLISVVFIPHFGRVARAQTMSVRSSLFLEAEHVLGAQRWRILLHHVLPNIIGPIFVLASMDIPVVITVEAGLSFLGVGIRPPLSSWGGLLHDGYTYLGQSIWPVVASGTALILATLGFALFGESLRDAMDPKLRQVR